MIRIFLMILWVNIKNCIHRSQSVRNWAEISKKNILEAVSCGESEIAGLFLSESQLTLIIQSDGIHIITTGADNDCYHQNQCIVN